jgi:hypothetical protein
MRLVVAFSNSFTSAPKKTGFIVSALLNAPQHPYTLPSNGHPHCFPAIILIMGVDLQPNNSTEIGTSKRAVQLKKTLERHSIVTAMNLANSFCDAMQTQ